MLQPLIKIQDLEFTPHPSLIGKEDKYTDILVNVQAVIKSYHASVYSFEWLDSDGTIKDITALPKNEQEKRNAVQHLIDSRQPISKPVLGIGIEDNIEFGIGRAAFLTAAAHGIQTIPVHVRISQIDEFKEFLG